MTGANGEDPQADGRPWPAPGADAGWSRGQRAEAPDRPTGVPTSPAPAGPRRPAPSRHRETPPLAALAVAMEPAPIWEPNEGRGDWAAAALRTMRAGRRPRAAIAARKQAAPRARAPRRPLPGLAALVLLALVAAFLAWFSAEPLWLSLGHGTTGTAMVRTCDVHGVAAHCADFTADGDAFLVTGVRLLDSGTVRNGAKVPARMVSATGAAAYTGGGASRWAPSLLVVVLCGFAIAWLTGGYRLPGRRARIAVLALSVAGPMLLSAGMLAVTW